MHAVGLIGFFGDCLPQPEIPLLRPIAVKTFMSGQIIHGPVHGFNSRHGKRLRHIADAAANQPFGRLRMGFGKRIHAAPYFREQISRLQLEEVIVNVRHGFNSKRLIPYPERDGIKAPFRHAVLPCVTKRRSFPPCRSFRRAKAAAPALLRVHAPRRHPVLPDSPELLPGKIPKNGQADAQQGNLFILRGIMALKKPASFVPVLRQSCF